MDDDWVSRAGKRPADSLPPALDDQKLADDQSKPQGGEDVKVDPRGLLAHVTKGLGQPQPKPSVAVTPPNEQRRSFSRDSIRQLIRSIRLPGAKKPAPPKPPPRPPRTLKVGGAKKPAPPKPPPRPPRTLKVGGGAKPVTPKTERAKPDLSPWFENMHNAGIRATEKQFDAFRDMVTKSNEFSFDQKIALITMAEDVRDQTLALLEEELASLKDSELLSEESIVDIPEKKQVARYKEVSRRTQKCMQRHIQRLPRLIALNADGPELSLSDSGKAAVAAFEKGAVFSAGDLESKCRFDIMHEADIWDPDIEHQHEMIISAVRSDSVDEITTTSSFQAQGVGAYSSQAPRNRTSATAVVANFFRSRFNIGNKPALDVTRSAITVEFDQADGEERAKTNKVLVKQVLDVQAGNMLEKMSWEEIQAAQAEGGPIVLESQTVNLLTPDRVRTWTRYSEKLKRFGARFHHAVTGAPADDERSLAKENMKACDSWNGRTQMYRVVDKDGVEHEVEVQYSISYFNIPNNVMYEKVPGFLTFDRGLKRANNRSFAKLEADVGQRLGQLDAQYTQQVASLELTQVDSTQTEQLAELEVLRGVKSELRKKVSKKTRRRRNTKSSRKEFAKFQAAANTYAKKLNALKARDDLSDDMKAAIALMEERSNLEDLFLDTEELFKSGMSRDVTEMDNNRSALATRIILLGSMMEGREVHFGCRSGKDRTGLVDIEAKLLLTLTEILGRVPSYREMERLPGILELRDKVTLESGNVDDIVRANLGSAIGINTGGCASDPLEEPGHDTPDEAHKFTKEAQAFASMAHRPPVHANVEVGHGFHRDALPPIAIAA